MLVLASGGLDPIYTFDPKSVKEVESDVDVPFARDAIVSAGNFELGPLFGPLTARVRDMAFVRGVRLATANHVTGCQNIVRMRTKVAAESPTIFELLGLRREGPPLGSLFLGTFMNQHVTSGYFGGMMGLPQNPLEVAEPPDLFDEVDASDPDELRRAARVLSSHARSLRASGANAATRAAAAHLDEAAALFAHLPRASKFTFDPSWLVGQAPEDLTVARSTAMKLQRAVWALENDLTSSVAVDVGGGSSYWDTHIANTKRQVNACRTFMPLFMRFLRELDARSNSAGGLGANSAIILGSEVGRFPRLNSMLGKDHFADACFAFFGPSFNAGMAFGATGRNMEGLPLSTKTGRPESSGHVPLLDDIGFTLLTQAGLDPTLYGYEGRHLEFLVRS